MSDTAAQPADARPVGLLSSLWAAGGLAASVALFSGLSAQPARAFVQITLTETSSGVNAAITGSANLDGLTLVDRVGLGGTFIGGSSPGQTDYITVAGAADSYLGLVGPLSFGAGLGTTTPAGGIPLSGGGFALSLGILSGGFPLPNAQLALPSGYSSGDPLNASASWDGETLATLGLTPGSFEWTWGTGPNQRVNLSIVPVPAPLPIFGAAAAFGYSRKLRKRIKHGKRPPVAEA